MPKKIKKDNEKEKDRKNNKKEKKVIRKTKKKKSPSVEITAIKKNYQKVEEKM